jgi:ABC-type lipoprotein release transport system permease subunit
VIGVVADTANAGAASPPAPEVFDPLTMAATAGMLGAVAVAAAWRPASIASRVDPVVALRYE